MMENLFDSLCSCLMLSSNRERFLKGEGLQLMNLMLRQVSYLLVLCFFCPAPHCQPKFQNTCLWSLSPLSFLDMKNRPSGVGMCMRHVPLCVCVGGGEYVSRRYILVCLCPVVSVGDTTAPLKGNVFLLLLLLCWFWEIQS